jgi:hypothetical protein
MTRTLVAVALATLAALPGAAAAAPREESFIAQLTGEAERPIPRETPARGHMTIHLNRDGTATYRLVASNIDNVVGAHIHCAANEDQTAGIAVHLSIAKPGQGNSDGVNSSGTFDPSAACPDRGPITVLQALRAGLAYVNVHTDDGDPNDPPNTGPGDFPGGEVRGQFEPRG